MRQWRIGDVTITSIVEMEGPIPGAFVLPDATPEALAPHDWLVPHFADADGNVVLAVQLLVVESDGARIAVDTCVGNDKSRPVPFWDHLQTPFLDDLVAAGFPPESFDLVVCTHLHVDHVGWNTRLVDGRWVPTFPNARYLFNETEYAHWHSVDDAENREILGDSVQPVLEAGLVDLTPEGHALTDEVVLVPTPGHTPGHQSVRIASGGEDAVITGDLMHHPVQCTELAWTSHFDTDQDLARATRRDFLAEREADGALVIGTHFGGPGAGRVVGHGESWRLHVAERPGQAVSCVEHR